MININKELIEELLEKAASSERKRMNYDLRSSEEDGGQRMLNALIPGSLISIHRHPMSNENVICVSGKLEEVLYEEETDGISGNRLKEVARYLLDPSAGNYGLVVPLGVWHTVEVLEPSVIYEAKDGKYGEDGTESW